VYDGTSSRRSSPTDTAALLRSPKSPMRKASGVCRMSVGVAAVLMRRLGRGDEGAVRAGIVHYNTADEVDRLLEEFRAL
jgi:selenocysteine lyase/cysteine desulfurase